MDLQNEAPGRVDRDGGLVRRVSPAVSGVASGLVVMLVTGVLLALLSWYGTRQHERIAEERLRALAAAAVTLVDGDAHERIRDPAQTAGEEYERTIRGLVDFHNQLPGIFWVYTMRVLEGRLYYVLDTSVSSRFRLVRDSTETSRVMDPVMDFMLTDEPDLLPTILSGQMHVDERTYASGGRLFRSVQAPIRDGKGRVVAMLALDLEESAFSAELRSFQLMVLVATVVCAVLSLLTGLLVWWLHLGLLTAMRRLEREGITDSLTGLGNRSLFNRALASGIARARRTGGPFTLLLFDIDHFKRINDTRGHPAGDEVLRQIGLRLRSAVRAADICCRIGGEEFALLMPGIGPREGEAAYRRVSAAIREPIALADGDACVVTISGGVAALSGTDAAPDVLLQRADRALYAAKGAGRDRVVAAD